MLSCLPRDYFRFEGGREGEMRGVGREGDGNTEIRTSGGGWRLGAA